MGRLAIALNIDVRDARAGGGRIEPGGRNRALFEHLMREVRHVDDFATLLDVARTLAEERFAKPMPDAEVVKTATSVWNYEMQGLNRFGAGATVNMARDVVLAHAAKNPDAFALLGVLQAHHKGVRAEFAMTGGLAASLGWTVPRFKKARDYLLERGLITRTHAGGRGPNDPARYRF